MARKKRKKTSKDGGFFTFLGKALGAVSKGVFKALPLGLAIASGGAIFIGVRDALYADPFLAIRSVLVEPADALSAPQRTRLESMLVGQNILTADLKKAAQDLEVDPGIQTARLVKNIPGAVNVLVTRRKPMAFIRFSPGGRYGMISEDGVILETVAPKDATGLLIEAYEWGMPPQPSPGGRLKQKGFHEAMAFVKVFQNSALARREILTKIMLDRIGNVSIVLGEGPEIRLGRKPQERFDALGKAAALLEGEGRKNMEYVDLQFENVIVKQKRGAQ